MRMPWLGCEEHTLVHSLYYPNSSALINAHLVGGAINPTNKRLPYASLIPPLNIALLKTREHYIA